MTLLSFCSLVASCHFAKPRIAFVTRASRSRAGMRMVSPVLGGMFLPYFSATLCNSPWNALRALTVWCTHGQYCWWLGCASSVVWGRSSLRFIKSWHQYNVWTDCRWIKRAISTVWTCLRLSLLGQNEVLFAGSKQSTGILAVAVCRGGGWAGCPTFRILLVSAL